MMIPVGTGTGTFLKSGRTGIPVHPYCRTQNIGTLTSDDFRKITQIVHIEVRDEQDAR